MVGSFRKQVVTWITSAKKTTAAIEAEKVRIVLATDAHADIISSGWYGL